MIQRAWNEPIFGKLYPVFPQPWLWWGVSSKSDRGKVGDLVAKGQASSFTIDIRPSTAAQVLNTLSMRGVLTKAPGHSKSEGMWSSSPCESAQNVPKGSPEGIGTLKMIWSHMVIQVISLCMKRPYCLLRVLLFNQRQRDRGGGRCLFERLVMQQKHGKMRWWFKCWRKTESPAKPTIGMYIR